MPPLDDTSIFAGTSFIREDVYAALHLKHSQTSTDAALFKPKVLDRLPKLQSWFDDPDGPYSKKFAKMSIPEFKKYQEAGLVKRKGNAAMGESSTAKGKKRTQKEYDDSDEGDDSRAVAKRTKKGRKHSIDSDELDSMSP